MHTIFKPYCSVINILYNVSAKLGDKVKLIMLHVSVLLTSFIGIIRYLNPDLRTSLYYNVDYFLIAGVVLFILFLLSIINRKVSAESLRPNMIFWSGWFLCFIAIIITSFINPVRHSYLTWSILSLTVIPMISIVFRDQEDFRSIAITIARDIVLISFVFFFMNFMVTPFVPDFLPDMAHAYRGICSNENHNGMVCLAFFSAALYLMIAEEEWRFSSVLCICMSIALSYISESKTAELAMIAEVLAALLIMPRTGIRKDRNLFTVIISFVIAIALSAASGVFFIHLERTDYAAYAAVENKETSSDIEEYAPGVDDVSDFEEAVEWCQADETRNLINQLSTGRLMLWKANSKYFNLTGNGALDGPLMPEYPPSEWAHNNLVDVFYASGAFAFAGYAIWLLAGLIFVLKVIFRPKKYYTEGYLLSILSFLGLFAVLMLEITVYPTTTGIVFLSYITLFPIAFNHSDSDPE